MIVKVHLGTRMTVVRLFPASYTYDNILSATYWQDLNADAFCCKKAQYIRTNFRPVVPGPGTFCDTPTPSSKLRKSFRCRHCRKDSLFGSYCFPNCALPGISDMLCYCTGSLDRCYAEFGITAIIPKKKLCRSFLKPFARTVSDPYSSA